ncbi:MAG: GGDEF domain-containing protein [Eubacterium sp.]|jgi:diguanylate cyclase (GGDEF)-like protein
MMNKEFPRKEAVPDFSITHTELLERIRGLNTVFDTVRVVNPSVHRQIVYHADGTHEILKSYCFSFWKRHVPCANCISAKTFATKQRASKFEFVDNEIYLLVSEYLEVNKEPCVLESILHLNDQVMIDACGKNEFVSRITQFNERLYRDSLTQVRNRRYYDEQVSGLTVQAAAMIDIDQFKNINDSWMHKAGDAALQAVASAISGCVRKSDLVLRYGGDEFILAFEDIPEQVFRKKLQDIEEAAGSAEIPGYPGVHLTISIGGVYEKGQLKDELEKADAALYEAKETRNRVVIR